MAVETIAAYSLDEWVRLIGFGGLVGALGQSARAIVGLKKVNDATSGTDATPADVIVASRLLTSIAIGFVAGAGAAIGIVNPSIAIPGEQIFALAAAGYAGTDAIEGFIKRATGTSAVPSGQEAVGIGSPAAASAGSAGSDAVG